jgi:hypothetical protein
MAPVTKSSRTAVLLHKVFKSDATDVILQHSLIISVLRVAKWWQNGKIGPKMARICAKNDLICSMGWNMVFHGME